MKPLLILILIASCRERVAEPKAVIKRVEMKYCISECMKYEFKKFHAKGDSWGTSSSSMSGLSQKSIYDKVKEDCLDFYKGSDCCKRQYGDLDNKTIKSGIHGYKFGECPN